MNRNTPSSPIKAALILLACGLIALALQPAISKAMDRRKVRDEVERVTLPHLVSPGSAFFVVHVESGQVSGFVDSQNTAGAIMRTQLVGRASGSRLHELRLGDKTIAGLPSVAEAMKDARRKAGLLGSADTSSPVRPE